MKLEPVAWALYWKEDDLCRVTHDEQDAVDWMTIAMNEADTPIVTPLYAIPEGYVVVPVSLLKRANAAMMEWAAKYGEHNPQWLPPARVSELSTEIEAMIAKEQS